MATTPRKDLPGTNAPNWSQRVTEELRVLMGRGGNGRALTAKDLIDSGIAKPGAGGGLVPGVPGGGDIEPDLTPPPMPTGFAVTAGLTTVFVEHDAPGYTQGHGHDRTVVYGVLQTGSTAPTFDQAVVLFQFQGTIGAYPAALGTRYRLWIKWQSKDGVQSVSPAGGINGLDVQTGKIGNNDLGPLIVEAGNLANGSVSASKLAAQAVDATKFANGIEPVSVSTAATLPTVKSTSTIVWQGKLYRWDGSKYTAAVPTVDLTGTIIASQIAAGAVDVTKFASGIEPVTNSAAASLPTVKTTTVITWQGKLYRWDGSKYSAEVAVVDLTGQIDSAKLADNAVTVSKIAAGAVEAGKLATGAVTADKIAAAAVDATKFASGIEPVTISAAASLPTVKSTTVITWQGKLYRWDGAKYTTATAAADVTGQLTDAQLAAISAAKLTGQITGTQITDGAISTPKIAAGAVSANQIAAGAVVADKLAANAVTAAAVAAGAITTAKLAANAVTANELAANAVIAGKIAAGAVSADQIAAGAITASKLLVANTANIYPDFDCVDLNFYTAVAGTFSLTGSGVAANGRNIVNIAPSAAYSEVVSGWFSIESLADYSIKSRISLESVDAATLAEQYIEFATYVGANISNPTITRRVLVGASSSNSATPFVAQVTAAGSERLARMVFTRAAGGTARGYIGAPNMVRMASGNLIVDGAITAAKIAAKTITAAEIAAGTITAAELGAGSVTAGKIAAGTVTANELATNSVTAVKIAAGAVTAGKIAANAVTANEIAANSVTTAKIAAGAVSATEIAAATILASKLVISDQSNMLADSEFLDTTGYWNLSTAELSTDAAAVAALNCTPVIVNRAGTTARFDVFNRNSTVYMSVEPGKTYRLSIQCFVKAGWNGRAQLNAQGFLSNGWNGSTSANSYGIDYRVTAVAVDTTFTLTLDYTASSTTSFLRFRILADFTDAAVAGLFVGRPRVWLKQDADLIVDGAIVAAKLAAGSVTANAIAANSVTTNAIAANAVTANEIAANAVTTAQIAAGAVKADQIAAGAITARQLVVADFANLVPDPDFANLGSGSGDGSWYVVGTTVGTIVRYAGAEGAGVLLTKYAGQTAEMSARSENWRNNTPENFVPVKEGDKLRVQCVVTRKAGASGGNIGLYADTLSSDGVSSGTSVSGVAGNTPLEVQQEVSGEYTVPAGVVGIRFRIYYGASAASAGGSVAVTKISVRRMNTAELIVDGAITATKIAANAIAVGSAAIQDGAIVNAMIGNLSADKINAGTLNAARIAAGTISSSHLAANSVIAGKIAANAVTAGTIAANAVTATQIAAGAITVDKLAAGSITAEKLSIGVGGNLCPDSTFTPGLAFWSYGASHAQLANCTRGVNMNADYSVPGSPTLFIEDGTNFGVGQPLGTYRKVITSAPVSVIPGERYEASIYAAFHRCYGEMFLEFFDANGTWVGGGGFGAVTWQPPGGKPLANYSRLGGFTTAPVGAVTARLTVTVGTQLAGTTNWNYAFLTRPFIGRASANQTELSPWSPSSNTSILPDGITTPSISALAGKFGDIEIRPTAGASGCIRVYDSNGTLRVRLGVW